MLYHIRDFDVFFHFILELTLFSWLKRSYFLHKTCKFGSSTALIAAIIIIGLTILYEETTFYDSVF